jgi:glycosyltransferase involved in cell wall biosynthesis
MDEGPLHVGLVAPLWYPIAPDRGGIEQVIALLARELRARGHRVTLIAAGDSTHDGRLVPVCPEGIAAAMEKGLASEYPLYEAAAVGRALRLAREVDVLHSHLGARLVPLAAHTAAPVVHTMHTSISRDMRWLLEQFPRAHVTTVSHWQAAALAGVASPVVIANGIDLDAFPFSAAADDYLLVLGRLEARKGVDVAIDVAHAAGRRLVIAGHVADRAFFAERIRPRLDGDRVRWFGPVGGAEKIRILQRAHALLFPVQWEEAFGLVMVEAMACGTPVVALARGAVPEIVVPGENGFHTERAAMLPSLVDRVAVLDRARVRATVERRFSHRRMVSAYVELYRRVIADETARRRA